MADQEDDAPGLPPPDGSWRPLTVSFVPIDREPFVVAVPPGVRLTPVDHDPFADDTGYRRSAVLPVRTNLTTGENEPAWPRAIADPVRAWVRSMDAARAGQKPNIDDALQVSSAMVPGAILGRSALARAALPEASGAAEALGENMVSRNPFLYNPPAKPPRPIATDYPAGAASDEAGRLTADIEGRPLVAGRIVGRAMVGGPEQALSAEGTNAVGAQATGTGLERVAARQLRGDAGQLHRTYNPTTGIPEYRILLNQTLDATQATRVAGHEVGHAIDEIAGQIPTKGLNAELRGVYNTLATGRERTRNLTGPQHLGYSGEAVPRELMAEAVRAYMTDPNYLKTVAPNTAKAIRDAVNAHPTLSRIIQFNAIGAGALPLMPADHDPIE